MRARSWQPVGRFAARVWRPWCADRTWMRRRTRMQRPPVKAAFRGLLFRLPASSRARCDRPDELGLHTEQPGRGTAENVRFLAVVQRCRRKNMIHGMQFPGIGIVAPQDDLAGPDLSRQMPDRLRREDQRIEVDLL